MSVSMTARANALLDLAAAFSLVVLRIAPEERERIAEMGAHADALNAPGAPREFADLIHAVKRLAAAASGPRERTDFNEYAAAQRHVREAAETMLRRRALAVLEAGR